MRTTNQVTLKQRLGCFARGEIIGILESVVLKSFNTVVNVWYN